MEKDKITAKFIDGQVTAEKDSISSSLYDKSRFGEPKKDKYHYSLVEASYLLETGKSTLLNKAGRDIPFDRFVKQAVKYEPGFWIRYCVFRDMRSRGYIVKTALKFGADFRVYDRGVKPGEDHAKWILYPVHEGQVMSWYKFSAMNRVAHSTRKKLLVGCVDDEDDVTYWIISWTKP